MEVPHETVTTVKLSDFWDPLYDSFDVDLVIKVLAHTLFSTHLLPPLRTFQLRPLLFRPVLYLLYSRFQRFSRRSLDRALGRLPSYLQSLPLCFL